MHMILPPVFERESKLSLEAKWLLGHRLQFRVFKWQGPFLKKFDLFSVTFCSFLYFAIDQSL